MFFFKRSIGNFPLNFSYKSFDKKKKRILFIICLNNTEYKGRFEGLDKIFNFTLNKCSRLSIFDLIFHSNHYEIIFIRGENIINFLSNGNKKYFK